VALTLGLGSAAHAQEFDGLWSGSFACDAFRGSPAYSNPVAARITNDIFKMDIASPGGGESLTGIVAKSGRIDLSGQGQAGSLHWEDRFSGLFTGKSFEAEGFKGGRTGRPCHLALAKGLGEPAAPTVGPLAAAPLEPQLVAKIRGTPRLKTEQLQLLVLGNTLTGEQYGEAQYSNYVAPSGEARIRVTLINGSPTMDAGRVVFRDDQLCGTWQRLRNGAERCYFVVTLGGRYFGVDAANNPIGEFAIRKGDPENLFPGVSQAVESERLRALGTAKNERRLLEQARQDAIEQGRQAAAERQEAEAAKRRAEIELRSAEQARKDAQQASVDKEAALAALRKAEKERRDAAEVAKRAETARQVAEVAAEKAENAKQEAERKAATVQVADNSLGLSTLPTTESDRDWRSVAGLLPVQERQFCRIVERFFADLSAATTARNAIKQNALYKQRQEDLASLLPNGAYQSWIVRAVEVTQAADGSAAVVLQLPCKVLMGSDACAASPSQFQGTIPENSPLYRELAKFDTGDFAVVSGTFLGVSEPKMGALPSYRFLPAGTSCIKLEAGQSLDLFVVQLNSIFRMRD
jgi:hypothetical protein